MKSVKINFNKMVAKNPGWSTYTCFASAIKGKNFSKETLRKWFNKLVNKEDYLSGDKKAILSSLYDMSHDSPKVVEDTQK